MTEFPLAKYFVEQHPEITPSDAWAAEAVGLYRARKRDYQVLASAMRKMLPAPLLQDVIDHLDPLTPFVEYLRAVEKPSV